MRSTNKQLEKKLKKPLYITSPSLAPLNEFKNILEGVWKRGTLTNNGPLVQLLEKELIKYLNIKNIVAVTNGTIAIQLAIRALGLKGEIITTPFTWIATLSSIVWEGCTPVFADIDPYTLNINPLEIEKHITKKTVALLPVHVFSNPCDIEAINSIAKKHNLKVIYDAAHAFGVNYKGKSVLEYGDISTTSFHATKLFNTAEGGACITTNKKLHELIYRLRFFGHDHKKDVLNNGCNAKLTEIHAALGLANLKYTDSVRADRKAKYKLYKNELKCLDSIRFQKIKESNYNYSYMPVIFKDEELLLKVNKKLNEFNIVPGRYFYPSVNTFKIFKQVKKPISEDISKRILCLPLCYNIQEKNIKKICRLIIQACTITTS